MLIVALLTLQSSAIALENDYVRVTRDAAPCAQAPATCGDRVIVAMAPVTLGARKMARGDIAVFRAGEKHAMPSGSYFEVALKPRHPAVQLPDTIIPPSGTVTTALPSGSSRSSCPSVSSVRATAIRSASSFS
jgi:hypothetical protein